MDSNGSANDRRPASPAEQVQAITEAIRELAYAAWTNYRRELHQGTDRASFDRVYRGHYSSIDTYVIRLVDDYDLDAKLDEAIGEPFRSHVDIDITALGRALVASETVYSILAVPVGVWVFDGEIA